MSIRQQIEERKKLSYPLGQLRVVWLYGTMNLSQIPCGRPFNETGIESSTPSASVGLNIRLRYILRQVTTTEPV